MTGVSSVVAVLYVGACIYLWATQTEKVFLPMRVLQSTPARVGLLAEEVRVPVGGATTRGELHGYWIAADPPGAPTFLYLHGQNCNVGRDFEHVERLHRLGWNVLLVDYRGFGKSSQPSRLTESQVYEDAEAAWTHLIESRKSKPAQTFIYGHSLGGAIALELAIRHPEAAGLIVESSFTSVRDIAKGRYHGLTRLLPLKLIIHERFDSVSKLPRLKVPVLFVHGTWDQKVPYQMSEQLYAAAPQPKQLLLIEGGEHVNSGAVGWSEYSLALKNFVERQCSQSVIPARAGQITN